MIARDCLIVDDLAEYWRKLRAEDCGKDISWIRESFAGTPICIKQSSRAVYIVTTYE